MLKVTIPPGELFDEDRQEFLSVNKEYTLQLEHSLVSLSKWESKWNRSFLEEIRHGRVTPKEMLYYVKCMTITQNIPDEVYLNLPGQMMKEIIEYINAPMTATTFNNFKPKGGRSSEIVTSELIYYWMISAGIPFECQKWHLNRLMTLIEICNRKGMPQQKMSQADIMRQYSALNSARRKRHHTKG